MAETEEGAGHARCRGYGGRGRHGKRRHVLSDYTFAVRRSETDGELLNIGKAYSGLTDIEIAEMTEWFRAHTVQEFAHGRVRVVEPAS